MHSADQQVLEQLRRWLEEGTACWLVTIIATQGSAPRPVGSLVAFNTSGASCGSVSGGCIEDDIVQRIVGDTVPKNQPSFLDYGLTPEENEKLGLPCGGQISLLVQPLPASDENKTQFAAIVNAVNERRCIRRISHGDNNCSAIEDCERYENFSQAGNTFIHCFGPHYLMLLVGAGQLSKTLAELAIAMDYRVIVCDPRPRPIEDWDLAGVEAVFDMPDTMIQKYANDAHSVIISLTHTTSIDDLTVKAALLTDAFYIGALGSRRTSDKRRARLQADGFTSSQIDRLHAPVGLDIGSKTPIEIAVSIMAELTAIRAKLNKTVTG